MDHAGSPRTAVHRRAGRNARSDKQKARSASQADDQMPAASRVIRPQVNLDLPLEERPQEVRRVATELFALTGSWVVFYREMLGVDGVCRELFPTSDEMRYFENTPEFAELQEIVAVLRSQDASKGDAEEPERMITIRLPKSLHDSLRVESEELNLSINKLCISKLLQRIDRRSVPVQQGRRRGRRPGPQGPRKPNVGPKATGHRSAESGQDSEADRGTTET